MVCLNGHFKFLKGSLSQILPQPSRCCDTSFKSIPSTKFLLIVINRVNKGFTVLPTPGEPGGICKGEKRKSLKGETINY